MQPATEILGNVVTIAEIMSSRKVSAPDVPYLELAKCIRVKRPKFSNQSQPRDRSSGATVIGHLRGPDNEGQRR